MHNLSKPTEAELDELRKLLDSCLQLGVEIFRRRLLDRAKSCDWQWLPPTKPPQWFNRTAACLASEYSFQRYSMVQASLDQKPMPSPTALRTLLNRAIEDTKAEPQ